MDDYLCSVIKRFAYYRELGLRAMEQLEPRALFWRYNRESNSIAIIVGHLYGNMLSRWTNFLSEDGEKAWRNRDAEFEETIRSRDELLSRWNAGWDCLLAALESLTAEDLRKTVTIRGEKHTVVDAVNRQLSHYAYHVGQIVFIAKMIRDEQWRSLSIARGKSRDFNKKMAGKHKSGQGE